MPHLARLCMIIAILVLSAHSEQTERSVFTELCDLLQSDTNGDLHSHMFLAAYHGYDVSPDGIVTIDGDRYEIWPEVKAIG